MKLFEIPFSTGEFAYGIIQNQGYYMNFHMVAIFSGLWKSRDDFFEQKNPEIKLQDMEIDGAEFKRRSKPIPRKPWKIIKDETKFHVDVIIKYCLGQNVFRNPQWSLHSYDQSFDMAFSTDEEALKYAKEHDFKIRKFSGIASSYAVDSYIYAMLSGLSVGYDESKYEIFIGSPIDGRQYFALGEKGYDPIRKYPEEHELRHGGFEIPELQNISKL